MATKSRSSTKRVHSAAMPVLVSQCNGFIKDQTVNLQGDQTEKIYDELIQMGYDSDQIVFNL